MNNRLAQPTAFLIVAGMILLLATTASAIVPKPEELRQVSPTAIVYKGPLIQLAMSYKFTKLNPKGDWLLLDTVLRATGAPVEVPRTAISVRTPTGTIVPLATQEAFAAEWHELGGMIQRADIAEEPLSYLLPYRYRPLRLFSRVPAIVFSSAWLDERHDEFGRLYFQLPSGIQRGNYELLVNLKDGQVAVPFTI
jgi:hypothetical protein